MEEDDEYRAPYWLPSSDSFRRSRRSDSSSFSFSSGTGFVILLLAAAVAFILFGVPSLPSFSFRPQSVKKSWDYLNLVLVLFAILCGFLSRNSNGGGETSSPYAASRKSNPSTPRDRWYEFSDRTPRSSSFNRMRSSSSYPDLIRQESLVSHADDRRRFFDDTHIYRSRRWTEEEEDEERSRYGYSDFQTKIIHVDRVEVQRQEVRNESPPPQEVQPPRQPSPPPPTAPLPEPNDPPQSSPPRPKRKSKRFHETPQPPASPQPEPDAPPPSSPPRSKAANRKPKRIHDAVAESHSEPLEEQVKTVPVKTYKLPPPPPPLPPLPPPSPPPLYDFYCEPKKDNNEKKRGGSAATKDFLTAFRKKKKKQRQKSVESFDIDSLFSSSNSHLPPPSPPPPPPPLPPPPSVFHNLFSSKKGRAKKSQRGQPPPPPPPPPPSRVSKTRSQAAFSQSHSNPPITTRKPPPPANSSSYNYASMGNRSPLIPIPPPPPPPPPPPFKVPDWKFVVRGDYVRIKSANASRSNSPEPFDAGEGIHSGGNSPSTASVASTGASEPTSPAIFCPSPDVNTKADDFIASFWAGLQLEKVNSIRQRTKSNLGPDPNPDPGPAL